MKILTSSETMSSKRFDITVIGAGIVGLATSMRIAEKYPRLKLLILEKEPQPALHQTGHNSGVIHSGIYYKPGSLKAKTCVAGRKALLAFCDEYGIPYDLCGKVIVATDREEVPRLEELLQRGVANGVDGPELIGPERLREIEPNATGIKALYSPATGIVDFSQVAHAYARRIRDLGGEILLGQEVKGIKQEGGLLVVETFAQEFHSKHVINCAGLFVDRVFRMAGGSPPATDQPGLRIVPFRGEFWRVIPERQSLVRALIYPLPDPRFPFLGAHFTRTIRGDLEVGPNAVPALAREGYRKSDVNLKDVGEILVYKGSWLMARSYWKTGLGEIYRSLSKRAFVKALQKLVPEVTSDDLVPSRAGVRAQAVSTTGALVDDFVISQTLNAIHVLNAPSPGATASLAIGERIAEIAARAFSLEK